MVEGFVRLGAGLVVLGQTLADDLSRGLGQIVRLQSAAGVASVLTLSGIYQTGNGKLDRSRIYVSLSTARTLFALPQGVTRIEIKLAYLNAADATDLRIRALTGLDAVPWPEGHGIPDKGADRIFPGHLCAYYYRGRGRGRAAAILASILPAQSAARVDPVTRSAHE